MRKRRHWLRGLAWTFGGLVAATGAGIAALTAFAPIGIMREQLIFEIKVHTGRDLVIGGQTSLSMWPSLAVTMGDVALSAPAGMGGAPLVRMKRLDASVAVMPLLNRRLEIKRVVLTEPVFELRIDAQGRTTWEFAALGHTPTIRYAQAPHRQGSGPGSDKAGNSQALPPELEEFLRNSSNASPTAPAVTPKLIPVATKTRGAPAGAPPTTTTTKLLLQTP